MIAAIKRVLRPAVASALRRLHRMSEGYVESDLPAFANAPKNLRIALPRRIHGAACFEFGDDVSLGPGSFLNAQTHYPTEAMQHPRRPAPVQHFQPKISIGHRVTATAALTIAAMKSVVIEDDVMFAANVMVSDGMHGFQHANEPYKFQPMWRIAPVVIGRGSWIGQNVVVMPGVTIGALCIVGANSVVTRSIPPHCIAFGNPAKVVKRWDETVQRWTVAGAETSVPVSGEHGQQGGPWRVNE